jgi:hypothetical protein
VLTRQTLWQQQQQQHAYTIDGDYAAVLNMFSCWHAAEFHADGKQHSAGRVKYGYLYMWCSTQKCSCAVSTPVFLRVNPLRMIERLIISVTRQAIDSCKVSVRRSSFFGVLEGCRCLLARLQRAQRQHHATHQLTLVESLRLLYQYTLFLRCVAHVTAVQAWSHRDQRLTHGDCSLIITINHFGHLDGAEHHPSGACPDTNNNDTTTLNGAGSSLLRQLNRRSGTRGKMLRSAVGRPWWILALVTLLLPSGFQGGSGTCLACGPR